MSKIEYSFVKPKTTSRPAVKLEIGFVKLGAQEPYFHVLAGEWDRREKAYICCADHELAAREWPEYAHLIAWHLAGITEGPMHYEANARYWFEICTHGRAPSPYDRQPPLTSLMHTIAWGKLPEERADLDVWAGKLSTFMQMIRDRKPRLMEKFHEEIEAAFPGMWDRALDLEE